MSYILQKEAGNWTKNWVMPPILNGYAYSWFAPSYQLGDFKISTWTSNDGTAFTAKNIDTYDPVPDTGVTIGGVEWGGSTNPDIIWTNNCFYMVFSRVGGDYGATGGADTEYFCICRSFDLIHWYPLQIQGVPVPGLVDVGFGYQVWSPRFFLDGSGNIHLSITMFAEFQYNIGLVTFNAQPATGDTITIPNGDGTSYIFEFTNGTPHGTNTAIGIGATITATNVNFIAAISASPIFVAAQYNTPVASFVEAVNAGTHFGAMSTTSSAISLLGLQAPPTVMKKQAYEIHPLTADLTSWSTPVPFTRTGTWPNLNGVPDTIIDTCVMYNPDDTNFYMAFSDWEQGRVVVASSASMLGPYAVTYTETRQGAFSNEAPTIIRIAANSYRLYIDESGQKIYYLPSSNMSTFGALVNCTWTGGTTTNAQAPRPRLVTNHVLQTG